MLRADTPLEKLTKVNRRIVPALRRLEIKTLQDLLLHIPSRYEDFSRVKSIEELTVGEVASIRGRVRSIENRRAFKRRMIITEAIIEDDSGSIRAVWFNQPFLTRNIKTGAFMSLSGKVAHGATGRFLQNPAYERAEGTSGLHTAGLVPIYPETRGITSRWLRYLIRFYLPYASSIPDALPEETYRRYPLTRLKDAISIIHFPQTADEVVLARRRFDFESLLLTQLRVLKERIRVKSAAAPEIPFNLPLIKSLVAGLPFLLTDAQRRAMWEIMNDLAKPRPMNRLLEGDVGSGKTVVAAAAALAAVKAGWRVAFMAPTEILARQHYETLMRVLAPHEIAVGLLTGSEKRDAHANLVVGTHALVQKSVHFEKLGLLIVDEQHRFGVEQRAILLKTSPNSPMSHAPHFLSMTATPIPRTLALTLYGDLDLSLLDEMPKNRKPITTKIVMPQERDHAYQFIRDEVTRGRQAFVICPRIETPEEEVGGQISQQKLLQLELKTVKEEHEKLSKTIFPDLKIAMLHGRMKTKEKDAVMKRFRAGAFQILVSTSVVEVGVDIPNATIMMIESAERFGLAQLHQFRGRVGRGEHQSSCFLFPTADTAVSRRLKALVDAKNGFELAEKDLEIRGPGDMLGTRQAGIPTRIIEALKDHKLIADTRREAAELIQQDPTLKSYHTLAAALTRFEQTFHRE